MARSNERLNGGVLSKGALSYSDFDVCLDERESVVMMVRKERDCVCDEGTLYPVGCCA